MGHLSNLRVTAVALCAMIGITAVTGCGAARDFVFGEDFEFQCPQPAHPAVAIAVGARANSPAPDLPAEVGELLTEAMRGCGEITVVRVDGRPSIVDKAVFGSAARTEDNFDIDRAAFTERIRGMMADARAQVPEADVLGALSLAAGAAGPGGTVVLIDSGVQTTGPVDFAADNLPEKRPEAIADKLRQAGLLPDLTGRSVIMAGLGSTAPPQGPLDARNQGFVRDLWREIVVAAGGETPTVLPESNTEPAATDDPPVAVVEFPPPIINYDCDAVAVLPDDGEVGFIPDQADFRDPAAARAVLAPLAEFLRTNSGAIVEVDGFIAHYGDGELSQRRADRVKRELVSLGVSNSIVATGRGWGPYPHPTAPPDPDYDQLNRRVTITVSCD